MRTHLLIMLIVSISTLPDNLQANEWVVDQNASSLKFEALVQGTPLTGEFPIFSTKIKFDPHNLHNAAIFAEVDLSSLTAGNSQAVHMLKGSEWFSTSDYSKAKFTSTKITSHNNGYEAAGTLSIKSVSVPFSLPFDVNIESGKATATADFAIDRSDFGIGEGVWKSERAVSHQVAVQLKITAHVIEKQQ